MLPLLLSLYGLIQRFRLPGRRNSERRKQERVASVIHCQGLGTLAQLLITGHELPVEFLGKAVHLKALLKDLDGLLPLQALFPVTSHSHDEPEELAAETLPIGKRTGIAGQKMAPVQAQCLLAQSHRVARAVF